MNGYRLSFFVGKFLLKSELKTFMGLVLRDLPGSITNKALSA